MHVVAIDYGVKRNILRLIAGLGAKVTIVPARTSAEDILAMAPDGVFLSNGPGDPAATGGICGAGHQETVLRPTCRCSASASAIRSWRWRSAG